MGGDINIIEAAEEQNRVNLKELIESTKDVVSVYISDTRSTRFVIRKVGYNGFTVVFAYQKFNKVWVSEGYSSTPDSIQFHIDNVGELQDGDSEFYKASHAYSEQTQGTIDIGVEYL